MVQKKVTEKLGVHGHKQPTAEKRLTTQNQDAINRPSDMRKKMKKSSRPINLPDLDSFTSSPIRKNNISQPGKPPPPPPVKPDASPNYMKSTSSFDARKIPVSCLNIKTTSVKANKIPGGQFLEPKSVTRSSTLTPIRTLTKTPTFKPVRASSKKCSPAGICEEINSQRATCSSTLKDYKFPAYLELNHGGTECDGTSVFKICPYTYCSLNGHRHSPLPPLKSFLSSRRRSLKALSTPEVNLAGDVIQQVSAIKVALKDDQDDLPTLPLLEEAESDFFVEIYYDEPPKSEEESGEEITAERSICRGTFLQDEVVFTEDDECGDSDSTQMEWEEQVPGNKKEDHEQALQADDKGTADFEEQSNVGDSDLNNDKDSEMEEIEISFDYDQCQLSSISDTFENSETEAQEEELFIANGVFEAEEDFETEENEEAPSFSQQNEDSQYEIHVSDDSVQMVKEEQIKNLNGGIVEEIESSVAIVSADNLNDDLTEEIETSQSSTCGMEGSMEQRKSEVEEDGIVEEPLDSCRDLKGTITSKSLMEEEEDWKFNPKEPNFLPEAEDPEAEKVDLRPQMVDDRRNSEEWMLDYALQRAVTKLAPARKKKVALLVEAFETVLPTTSKCEEAHFPHSSAAFPQPNPIQACF